MTPVLDHRKRRPVCALLDPMPHAVRYTIPIFNLFAARLSSLSHVYLIHTWLLTPYSTDVVCRSRFEPRRVTSLRLPHPVRTLVLEAPKTLVAS